MKYGSLKCRRVAGKETLYAGKRNKLTYELTFKTLDGAGDAGNRPVGPRYVCLRIYSKAVPIASIQAASGSTWRVLPNAGGKHPHVVAFKHKTPIKSGDRLALVIELPADVPTGDPRPQVFLGQPGKPESPTRGLLWTVDNEPAHGTLPVKANIAPDYGGVPYDSRVFPGHGDEFDVSNAYLFRLQNTAEAPLVAGENGSQIDITIHTCSGQRLSQDDQIRFWIVPDGGSAHGPLRPDRGVKGVWPWKVPPGTFLKKCGHVDVYVTGVKLKRGDVKPGPIVVDFAFDKNLMLKGRNSPFAKRTPKVELLVVAPASLSLAVERDANPPPRCAVHSDGKQRTIIECLRTGWDPFPMPLLVTPNASSYDLTLSADSSDPPRHKPEDNARVDRHADPFNYTDSIPANDKNGKHRDTCTRYYGLFVYQPVLDAEKKISKTPYATLVAKTAQDYRNSLISEAKVISGDLTNVSFAGFSTAPGAQNQFNSSGTKFTNAILDGTKFTKCVLKSCTFEGTPGKNLNLANTVFSRAILAGSTFKHVKNLNLATWTETKFKDCHLHSDAGQLVKAGVTNFSGIILYGRQDFTGIQKSTSENFDFSNARFKHSVGKSKSYPSPAASFANSSIPNANFENAEFGTQYGLPYICSFKNAELSRASFKGAKVADGDFTSAQLVAANLSGAHLVGAELTSSNLDYANISSAHLNSSKMVRSSLRCSVSDKDTQFGKSELVKSNFGPIVFGLSDTASVLCFNNSVDTERGPTLILTKGKEAGGAEYKYCNGLKAASKNWISVANDAAKAFRV